MRYLLLILLSVSLSCERIERKVMTAEFDSRELEAVVMERAEERLEELERVGAEDVGQWRTWIDQRAYVQLAGGLMRHYLEQVNQGKSMSRFADLYGKGGKVHQYCNLYMRLTLIERVAYGNGTFLAWSRGGVFFSSRDGKNWTIRDDTRQKIHIADLAFGAGRFVAVGDNGLLMSSVDGVSWQTDMKDSTIAFGSVCFGSSGFVCFGGNENEEMGFIAMSDDGLTWGVEESEIPLRVSKVMFGNGRYLASGLFGAATSLDGMKWDWLPLDDDLRRKFGYLPGATGNGVLVKLGRQGSILSSRDFNDWNVLETGQRSSIQDVAFGQGRFVAHGGETCWVSEDGVDWQRFEVTDEKRHGGPMAFGENVFIAIEKTGYIGWSKDGETWRRHESIRGRIIR